ncbi:hypothetical protein HDU96_001505 [Phlyctochytrium bullatum]|nr:hypothetical protein HDU96_001505 [Phlyctochytrium bullatum]
MSTGYLPRHSVLQNPNEPTSQRAAALSAVRLATGLSWENDGARSRFNPDTRCEATFQNEQHQCNENVGLVEVTEQRVGMSEHLQGYYQGYSKSALCPAKYLEVCRASLVDREGVSISSGDDAPSILLSLAYVISYTTQEVHQLDRMIHETVSRSQALVTETLEPALAFSAEGGNTIPLSQKRSRLEAYKLAKFLLDGMEAESIRQWILLWFYPFDVEGVDAFAVPDFMTACPNLTELALKLTLSADNLLHSADGATLTSMPEDGSSDALSTSANSDSAPKAKTPLVSEPAHMDAWARIVDVYILALETYNPPFGQPPQPPRNLEDIEKMESVLIGLSVCLQRYVVTPGILVGTLAALRYRLEHLHSENPRKLQPYAEYLYSPLMTILNVTAITRSASAFAAGCSVLAFLLDLDAFWISKGLNPILLRLPKLNASDEDGSAENHDADPELEKFKDATYVFLSNDRNWALGPTIVIPVVRLFVAVLQLGLIETTSALELLEKIAEKSHEVFATSESTAGRSPQAVAKIFARSYMTLKEILKTQAQGARGLEYMPHLNDYEAQAQATLRPKPLNRARNNQPGMIRAKDVMTERPFQRWIEDVRKHLGGDGKGPTVFSGDLPDPESLPLDLPDAELDALLERKLQQAQRTMFITPDGRVALFEQSVRNDHERWELLERSVAALSRSVANKVYNV